MRDVNTYVYMILGALSHVQDLGGCQRTSAGWFFLEPDSPTFLIGTFQKHHPDAFLSLREILHGLPIALKIKSNYLLESYWKDPACLSHMFYSCRLSHSQCPAHHPPLLVQGTLT